MLVWDKAGWKCTTGAGVAWTNEWDGAAEVGGVGWKCTMGDWAGATEVGGVDWN